LTARIVVCGKGRLAAAALAYAHDLLGALRLPFSLAAVPVASDVGKDTWEPSLRRLCGDLSIPAGASIPELRLDSRDILFSLQYDRILRLEDLNGARAFNLHFSALPRYRGCYPSMWPLRNGETQSGVSLHVLGAGIDDGDIVDQECVPLPAFLTAYDLYELYHKHGYLVFKRNLQPILEGREGRRPQDHARASYYGRASIDFSERELRGFATRSALECVNWLKSYIFPPYQLPRFDGREIVACEVLEWAPTRAECAVPAPVLRTSDRSAVLCCRDGMIRLEFRR
jgi:methionyl-tRNA formyltransferase